MHISIHILFLLSICYGNTAESSFGGQTDEDPKNPKFQKMAEEVVRGHIKLKESETKKIAVYKVTTQLVAGTVTRIQFRVFLVNGKSSMCNSEIWDKPWENVKQISYDCDSILGKQKLSSIVNSTPKLLRDPNNSKYRKLANHALGSYFETPGRKLFQKEDIKSISVIQSRVQINSQITTSIVFEITTRNNDQFECEGTILETPWAVNDEVKVPKINCHISQRNTDDSNGENVGGHDEQDPKDPKYKQLAQEAFQKYQDEHIGLHFSVKELKIVKVSTQIVEGVFTLIDFKAISTEGTLLQCHADILEQEWLHNKDIKVDCNSPVKSKLAFGGKQQLGQSLQVALSGGKQKLGQSLIHAAVNDYFKQLNTPKRLTIENSRISSYNTIRTRVGKEDVFYYKVDVLASTMYGDYSYFNCSVVFATKNHQISQIPIDVNCKKMTRLLGRSDWVDPSNEEFISFANMALQKYPRSLKKKYIREKNDVIVTFVLKGLSAGSRYEMAFIVRPAEDEPDQKCHAAIFKDFDNKLSVENVKCGDDNEKDKPSWEYN